jgi:pimeloyl-ACP methyl ester carboxylesterase
VNPYNTGSSSTLSPRDLTMRGQLEMIDSFLDQTTKKPPLLIGNSWGAIVAATYAAKFPSRLSGLIVTSPGPLSVVEKQTAVKCGNSQQGIPSPNIENYSCYSLNRNLQERLQATTSRTRQDLIRFKRLKLGITEATFSADTPQPRVFFTDMEAISHVALMKSYLNSTFQVSSTTSNLSVLMIYGQTDKISNFDRSGYHRLFPRLKQVQIASQGHSFSLIDCMIAHEVTSFYYKTLSENPKIECAIVEKVAGTGQNMTGKYVSLLADGKVPAPP